MKNISEGIYNIFKDNKEELIKDLNTEVILYEIENQKVITTVTNKITKNNYVVSIYNFVIDYSKEELIKIKNPILKFVSFCLIKIFEFILKLSNIDKIQILNNYMLSTNFFSEKFNEINLLNLKEKAINKYKDHTLIIRSINEKLNKQLITKLTEDGWEKIVSRQVYIYDNLKIASEKNNFKVDKKLLKDGKYEFIEINSKNEELFEISEELYNKLYIQKYSECNIKFTKKYLENLVKNDLMKLFLLKDISNNKFVGVVGLIGEDKIITAPIVGYETSYEKKEALYRRLIIFILEYSKERNLVLNLSSGASQFKKIRGAEATIEYMFVYTKHLPLYRRIIWKLLSFISIRFYKEILKRLEL